jgi:hypothetical protein
MRRYLPHLIYSVALTTVSLHLLSQRKASETQKARLTAQISILESIVHQLRSNNPLSNDELQRLRNLTRANSEETLLGNAAYEDKVSWRDVILGRRWLASAQEEESKWHKKDIEEGVSLIHPCSRYFC